MRRLPPPRRKTEPPMKMNILTRFSALAILTLLLARPAASAEKREVFELNAHQAFLYPAPTPSAGQPWLWYAPTLKGISLAGRKLYFDAFQQAGIAIAGY